VWLTQLQSHVAIRSLRAKGMALLFRIMSIMYDMPDEEILGFWGKRPFLAKRITRPNQPTGRKITEEPAVRLLPVASSFAEPAKTERLSSWRMDHNRLRQWRLEVESNGFEKNL